MRRYFFIFSIITFTPKVALGHCPLCTVGAGALAVLAASIGVSSIVVGVLIGAFSLALGFWLSGMVKKEYVRFQKQILSALIFLGTVIPIMPFIEHYAPLYISFLGEYGTTLTINLYILGVVIGALIMFIAPYISSSITKVRNRRVPFQGIIITISLLVITSIIIQVLS
ncbi:MAG: hypothetical protein WDZ88_03970 [Candidatus Paceibacterota bacterium]